MERGIWQKMKRISYSIVIEKDEAFVKLNDSVEDLTEEEIEQLASEIVSAIYERLT